ncbi:hypothetical protein AAMO2058_001631000 [Amorphochlora amoebiformis]
MQVNISVRATQDKDAAVLATFPRGIDKGVLKKKVKFTLKMPKEKTRRKRRRLEGLSDKVMYSGKNFLNQAASKNLSRYAIAMYSPGKKEVRMLGIEHVYEMDQRVLNVRNELKFNNQTPEALRQRKTMLIDGHASAKRKRTFNSSVKSRIKLEDDHSTHALQTAMLHAKSDDAVSKNDSKSGLDGSLPPHNLQTLELDQVYPVEGLLHHNHLAALHPKQATQLKRYPAVVMMIDVAKAVPNKKQRKLRLRFCMYLHYLIHFAGLGNKRIHKKIKDLQAPGEIQEHLLALFSTKDEYGGEIRRSQTNAQRSALLCRICVVSLIANAFQISAEHIQPIANYLKLTRSYLIQLYRQVGSKAGKQHVSLSAPLKLPKHKRASGPRK